MVTTYRQDAEFFREMQPEEDMELLGKAVEWIRSNLEPEDVFKERDLVAWAESQGYIKAEDE